VDSKLVLSRLTGRHIYGPGVFWSTLGYGLLAHALGSSDLGGGNLGVRLIAVVLAHFAMISVLFLTNFLTSKLEPGGFSLAMVATGYVAAGAVRGLILQVLLYEFGAAGSGFSLYRLIGGIVVMATGLVWAAFAFGIKAEWGAKRATLLATETQLEGLLAASESRLELEANDTMSTIESMLQTALIPELMVSPQNAVSKLQSLINDTLRPLSSFLAANQDKLEVKKLDPSVFKFRWRTLLTHLRLKESSRPVSIALILSVLAVNGFVQYLPDISALALMVFSFATMSANLFFSRHVLSRWVDRLGVALRVPMVLVTLFLCGFGGGVAVLSLANNPAVTLGLSVNAGVAAALLGALFGINHSATLEINSIQRQLRDYEYRLRWTIAALNGRHWLQKKQFARKLHGPVQSEVVAAAIRIERSLKSGEVTILGEEILQNLRDRLAKILNDTRGTDEIAQVLAEIIETWQGLCEIQLNLSAEVESLLRLDPVCVETVLEITREACSNAIRHGSADKVSICLGFEGKDLIKIEVTNNGNSAAIGSRRGMGSTYLEDCSFEHSLVFTDQGTVLTATVPIHTK
jgi:signal transduction histidine kinase